MQYLLTDIALAIAAGTTGTLNKHHSEKGDPIPDAHKYLPPLDVCSSFSVQPYKMIVLSATP